ncbi:MAG: hypothetical protein Q9221_004130 [Calogaya cf. arnoldii]
MDPFSVVVGIGSLIDLSLRLGKYLKDVHESIALFEGEIGFLLRETQDLDSVNRSIAQLYETETVAFTSGRLEPSREQVEVWQNTFKTLGNCTETVEELQTLLTAISGKHGAKVKGLRDGLKKHLKKLSKDSELNRIRQKLSGHRESLGVSLTLLNLLYSRKDSKDNQIFGFQLHKQIASLQARLPLSEADALYGPLHSATAIASKLRLNKHFDTPKTVSSIYTGRKGYLEGLKQAFDSSHVSSERSPTHKRFVVFGLGGAGKTQFCCKFASDNKQRFWGVFTVDASSLGNAQQSFIAIAKACGTDPNERAAKSWLSSSDRQWLLLIDNADDTILDIASYFPDGEHGLTLITTRNPTVKMHGTIGRRFYHFDKLDDDEANELLLRAADNHEPRTPTLISLASAITTKLGALPLALIHAGNAIKANYCKLSTYISYYERSWQLIRQNQTEAGQEEDDPEYMKVYASYEIVFRGLEAIKLQRYRDAVQLLKLFSFLHYEHIPFDFLLGAVNHPRVQREFDAHGATHFKDQQNASPSLASQPLSWWKYLQSTLESFLMRQFKNQNPVILPSILLDAERSNSSDDFELRLREALHLLVQLSLVTHYESTDSYSMHPLVHTWVRERPQMTVRIQAVWCEAALHTISRCVLLPPLNESVDPRGNLARRLLPHVISVGKNQQKIEREFQINRSKRNLPWPALETRLIPWRALFLAKCALVYSESGNFVEAENCLRIVMKFNQGFLGHNHPRTERVTLAVSDCLWQQCRVNEAAHIHEQLFQTNLRTLGPDHPRTLNLMAKLGDSRRQQGRLAESIELLTRAMAGMRAQLPRTDSATYLVQDQLGNTLRTCYRFEDAKQHQEQAVAGLKLCLGEDNLRTLIAMEELAITYKELGTLHIESNHELGQQYLATAHELAIFVVEQRKQQLGDKQPHTWMAQGTLGRIKAAMGEVDEAERVFSDLSPVAARHLGDSHLGVLSHKNHHSKILIQQKRYDEAENFLVDISRPEKYRTATFTCDHPDRWDALWTLAECYQKQGKIGQSLATCNELMAAVRAIRQGEKQTEISSTFWQMVLAKKTELMSTKDSRTTEHPTSFSFRPPSDSSRPTILAPGLSTISSDSPGTVLLGAGDVRRRVTTW